MENRNTMSSEDEGEDMELLLHLFIRKYFG